jgi:hypothetical protein
MMDYTINRGQPEGVIFTPCCRWGLAMAIGFSPSPTTDEVNRLYCQLVGIHAIGATQLVMCARWHRSKSPRSPVRA